MKFKVWFRRWVRLLFRLITFGNPKFKSEEQRKRERERRLQKKYAPPDPFYEPEKRGRRRPGNLKMLRLIGKMLEFGALSLGILFLPLGLFDWARKSARRAKKRKERMKKTNADKGSGRLQGKEKKANFQNGKTERASRDGVHSESIEAEPRSDSTPRRTAGSTDGDEAKSTVVQKRDALGERIVQSIDEKHTLPSSSEPICPSANGAEGSRVSLADAAAAADGDVPKSKPKSQGDRYIHKRLTVKLSCGAQLCSRLGVGSCLNMAVDNEAKTDVILLHEGERVGCLQAEDRFAFAIAIKQGRGVYAVITEIAKTEACEVTLEPWFEHTATSEKKEEIE